MTEEKKKKRPGRPRVPGSKRSQGQDRHTDPRFTFHLEQELLDALDDYCESFPHGVNRAQVMRDVLRDFLRTKKFFPRKKKEDE